MHHLKPCGGFNSENPTLPTGPHPTPSLFQKYRLFKMVKFLHTLKPSPGPLSMPGTLYHWHCRAVSFSTSRSQHEHHHTHTHTHTHTQNLHDHSVREYSSFMALITTRTWRFTSALALVGSESLLGFSRTPPQCWEAECTVLTHDSMDTSHLWALRPHEMGRPGGNTGKYKYRAG